MGSSLSGVYSGPSPIGSICQLKLLMVATDGESRRGNAGLKVLGVYVTARWVPFDIGVGRGGIRIVRFSVYSSLAG